MLSSEYMDMFTKWITIMPNKITEKFRNIYISNVVNNNELTFYSEIFDNSELIINNIIFDPLYITKSTYMFDVIIFLDNYNWINADYLNEIKDNILDKKGEIWILCEETDVNESKVQKTLDILDNTNLRNSVIKFKETCSLVLIRS